MVDKYGKVFSAFNSRPIPLLVSQQNPVFFFPVFTFLYINCHHHLKPEADMCDTISLPTAFL